MTQQDQEAAEPPVRMVLVDRRHSADCAAWHVVGPWDCTCGLDAVPLADRCAYWFRGAQCAARRESGYTRCAVHSAAHRGSRL